MTNQRESDAEKLTIRDAAQTLGVCRQTILLAIRDGLLAPVRGGLRGRSYWVTRESVESLKAQIGGRYA